VLLHDQRWCPVTVSLHCPPCKLPGATVDTVAEAVQLADIHDRIHRHGREGMVVTESREVSR
jgi:hypothetical protein